MAFEGSFLSATPAVSSTGSSFLQVSGCGRCGNLRFAGDGTSVGDIAQALFNDHGVYGFNAFGGAIPLVLEPGAWALMILGFAGAGASLRRHRASLRAAAA